jgi:hypothetical protein
VTAIQDFVLIDRLYLEFESFVKAFPRRGGNTKYRSDGADSSPHSLNGPNRRSFLRTAGLAGARAAALGAMTATPAPAAARSSVSLASTGAWNPDPESPRFTLGLMPDTQFLYWGSQGSVNSVPQEESFRYVISNSGGGSGGFAWANQFISDNSALPVILTTHEIAGPTYEGPPDALARMRRPVLQESLSKETYRHCVMAPAGALGYLRGRAGRISAEAPVMSQLAESSPAACCSTAHVITAASATWAASTVTDTRT